MDSVINVTPATRLCACRSYSESSMSGQNIICFAKDWSEDPTSNNHVMLELARHNRVLWLNSIATRTPSLRSPGDLRKIFSKLFRFFRGPQKVADNFWVYTPIVLPLPHSKLATSLNRWILRTSLRMLRRNLGMNQFQLWVFLPNAVDYVGTLGESVVVYYCVDEWSKFTYVDGPKIAAADRRLCQCADIVFGVTQALVDTRIPHNPETHLATHGVDHALFAKALLENTTVPQDLTALPQPVIGFYGTIQDWIDLDLIEHLAKRHPEWSITLIGKVCVDVSRFNGCPNVHLLGRRPHDDLPHYCKGFAVGIIPYILNERMMTVNPIKLREYLSAGLPVVSTAVPEVRSYSNLCAIAHTPGEFERAVQSALQTDTPLARRPRSHAMRPETWEKKVAAVGNHVMRIMRNKCSKSQDSV